MFIVFVDCPNVLDNTAIVDPVSPTLSACHDVTKSVTVDLPFTYHVTGFILTPNVGVNASMGDVDVQELYYRGGLDEELKLYNDTWTKKVGIYVR